MNYLNCHTCDTQNFKLLINIFFAFQVNLKFSLVQQNEIPTCNLFFILSSICLKRKNALAYRPKD